MSQLLIDVYVDAKKIHPELTYNDLKKLAQNYNIREWKWGGTFIRGNEAHMHVYEAQRGRASLRKAFREEVRPLFEKYAFVWTSLDKQRSEKNADYLKRMGFKHSTTHNNVDVYIMNLEDYQNVWGK